MGKYGCVGVAVVLPADARQHFLYQSFCSELFPCERASPGASSKSSFQTMERRQYIPLTIVCTAIQCTINPHVSLSTSLWALPPPSRCPRQLLQTLSSRCVVPSIIFLLHTLSVLLPKRTSNLPSTLHQRFDQSNRDLPSLVQL
jgi:hypothetical protein